MTEFLAPGRCDSGRSGEGKNRVSACDEGHSPDPSMASFQTVTLPDPASIPQGRAFAKPKVALVRAVQYNPLDRSCQAGPLHKDESIC